MKRKRAPTEPKVPRTVYPTHGKPYKVIAISLYLRDLCEVDAKVYQLQLSGFRTMNRSRLIRIALKRISVIEVMDELALTSHSEAEQNYTAEGESAFGAQSSSGGRQGAAGDAPPSDADVSGAAACR